MHGTIATQPTDHLSETEHPSEYILSQHVGGAQVRVCERSVQIPCPAGQHMPELIALQPCRHHHHKQTSNEETDDYSRTVWPLSEYPFCT